MLRRTWATRPRGPANPAAAAWFGRASARRRELPNDSAAPSRRGAGAPGGAPGPAPERRAGSSAAGWRQRPTTESSARCVPLPFRSQPPERAPSPARSCRAPNRANPEQGTRRSRQPMRERSPRSHATVLLPGRLRRPRPSERTRTQRVRGREPRGTRCAKWSAPTLCSCAQSHKKQTASGYRASITRPAHSPKPMRTNPSRSQ